MEYNTKTILTILILLLSCTLLVAQTPLKEIRIVGDIHNTLPGNGGDIYSSDEGIIAIDVATSQVIVRSNDLGVLPQAQIDGYHASDDGCDIDIYSLDTSTEVANVAMRGADVFKIDGTKILDANAESIPYGVNVNAVSRHPADCDLIFSIDTISQLGGTVYYPFDLIRYNSNDGFSLLHRFAFSADIDGIHMLSPTVVLLSIDITTSINGITVFDDDVFEFDILNNTTNLVLVPESLDPSWQAADVNAIWAKQAQPGTIQWQVDAVTVSESVGTLNLTVIRSNGSDGDIAVSYSSANGTAIANGDYIATNSSVTMLDGESSATVQIVIIDDNSVENSEDFTVSLNSVAGGAQIGTQSQITITITDNDTVLIFKDGFE